MENHHEQLVVERRAQDVELLQKLISSTRGREQYLADNLVTDVLEMKRLLQSVYPTRGFDGVLRTVRMFRARIEVCSKSH